MQPSSASHPLAAFPTCRESRAARYRSVTDGFFAGALAGALAESVVHPFDTISVRLKMQLKPPFKYAGIWDCARVVLAEEGVRGLYAGVGATLISALPTNAVYFATYEAAKHVASSLDSSGSTDARGWSRSSWVYAAAGVASELTSSLVYVPFEVIKTRLQTGRPVNAVYGDSKLRSPPVYRGALHGFAQIVRREGARGLYAGWGACIATDCCYSALLFVTYEELRRREVQPLVAGSAAGAAAALLSNPFEVVTTRQMIAPRGAAGATASAVARALLHEEGWRGLWKGALARAATHAPNAALMFAAYEGTRHLIESMRRA